MLCALRDLSRRIIGQPIVPRVQCCVAAADRIIFIPPRIILVCHFVQGGCCPLRTLTLERVFVYAGR